MALNEFTLQDGTLIKVHPAAALFPMLSHEEMSVFTDSIREHGQQVPIVLSRDGRLLDGRNRLETCLTIGVEPRFETYQGDDLAEFVVRMNVHRRHLSTTQRALLATGIAELIAQEIETEKARLAREQAKQKARDEKGAFVQTTCSDQMVAERQRSGERDKGKDADVRAAKAVGVSPRSVGRAKRVKEKAPELVDDMMAGKLSVTAAEESVRARDAPLGPDLYPEIEFFDTTEIDLARALKAIDDAISEIDGLDFSLLDSAKRETYAARCEDLSNALAMIEGELQQ